MKNEPSLLDYITPREASKRWNIARQTVAKYARQGKIPGCIQVNRKGGQAWLIPSSAKQPPPGKVGHPRKKVNDLCGATTGKK